MNTLRQIPGDVLEFLKKTFDLIDAVSFVGTIVGTIITGVSLVKYFADPWLRYYQWSLWISLTALIVAIAILAWQVSRLSGRGNGINWPTAIFAAILLIVSVATLFYLYIPNHQIKKDAAQGIETIEIVVTPMQETGNESHLKSLFDNALERAIERLRQAEPHTKLIGTFKVAEETNPQDSLDSDVLDRMRRNKGVSAVIWVQYWRDAQGKRITEVIPLQSSAIEGLNIQGISIENLKGWKSAEPPSDQDLAEWIADLSLLYTAFMRYGQGQYQRATQTFDALRYPTPAAEDVILERLLGAEPFYYYCLMNAAYETGQTGLLQKEIVIQTANGSRLHGTLEELGTDQLESLAASGELGPRALSYLHLLLGKTYIHQGGWSEAQKYLDQAIMSGIDERVELEAYYWLGVMQELQGKIEAAMEKFKLAAGSQGGMPRANLALGQLHFKQQEYDAARQEFETIVSADPCQSKNLCSNVCVDACYWLRAVYQLLGLGEKEAVTYAESGCCRPEESEARANQFGITMPGPVTHVLDRDFNSTLTLDLFAPTREDGGSYIAILRDGEEEIARAPLEDSGNGSYGVTLNLDEAVKRCGFLYWPQIPRLEAMKGFTITFYRTLKDYLRPEQSLPMNVSASELITVTMAIEPNGSTASQGTTLSGLPITVTSGLKLDFPDEDLLGFLPLTDMGIAEQLSVQAYFKSSQGALPDRVDLVPSQDRLSGEVIFQGTYTPTRETVYECYVILRGGREGKVLLQSDEAQLAAAFPTYTPTPTTTPSPTATPTPTPTSTPTATATDSVTPQTAPTDTPPPPSTPTPILPSPPALPSIWSDPEVCVITSPQNTSYVSPETTKIEMWGSAWREDFQRYELKLAPPGCDPWVDDNYTDSDIRLAQDNGTTRVRGDLLASWNTEEARENFDTGWYVLRLRVISSTGNYLECFASVYVDED